MCATSFIHVHAALPCRPTSTECSTTKLRPNYHSSAATST